MKGWYQVSRKHRMVARLPEGKTGIQALTEAAMRDRTDAGSWARLLGEGQAGDHFLRVYAEGDNVRSLDSAEWDAFVKSGGTTYLAAWHAAGLRQSKEGTKR